MASVGLRAELETGPGGSRAPACHNHLPSNGNFPVFYRRFTALTQRADDYGKAQLGNGGEESGRQARCCELVVLMLLVAGREVVHHRKGFLCSLSLLCWSCRRMGPEPVPMGSAGSGLARVHRSGWTMLLDHGPRCYSGIGSWASPALFAACTGSWDGKSTLWGSELVRAAWAQICPSHPFFGGSYLLNECPIR